MSKNLQNIPLIESNDLSSFLENLEINATIDPTEECEIHKEDDLLNDKENENISICNKYVILYSI